MNPEDHHEFTARVLLCILRDLSSSDYQYATTVAFHAAHKVLMDNPERFRELFGTCGEYAIKSVMENAREVKP